MPATSATSARTDRGDSALSFAQHLAARADGRTKGERTRTQLQIAACEILNAGGPKALTVAAVYELAGVSNGTFYIYFSDRNGLLESLLTEFVAFLQGAMRAASGGRATESPQLATRAVTAAYFDLFAQNAGLMRCLIHPIEGFPEAQLAFQRLNREWVEVVAASADRRQQREGGGLSRDELLRRAYALGGMVDQYLSTLLLSKDPNLAGISQDREAVLETLSLIWERGMMP